MRSPLFNRTLRHKLMSSRREALRWIEANGFLIPSGWGGNEAWSPHRMFLILTGMAQQPRRLFLPHHVTQGHCDILQDLVLQSTSTQHWIKGFMFSVPGSVEEGDGAVRSSKTLSKRSSEEGYGTNGAWSWANAHEGTPQLAIYLATYLFQSHATEGLSVLPFVCWRK